MSTPARGISEALIRRLVQTFYERLLEDPDLAPVFADALSHRWSSHLETMVDFWSSVALKTGRYSGKPHVAHALLQLTPALFDRWLFLFAQTATEICDPDVAAFFVDRARRIADSLQIGLGIGPKALHLPTEPTPSPLHRAPQCALAGTEAAAAAGSSEAVHPCRLRRSYPVRTERGL
jgi:hemoglobin